MKTQLTDRQEMVLNFIKAFTDRNGYPPTIREICAHFHFLPRAAANHVNALVRKGYLSKAPRKSRSLEVIGRSRRDLREIPIVGRVAAGEPILAVENIEGAIMLPAEWVHGGESFLLRVEGDSMVNAHICSGDYVVVKRQATAESGDIVVALLEEEATVKRFVKEKDRIVLKPENERMQPIVVENGARSLRIIGKVVGVWRTI
ncbi:MAG: transcriptional repressor LexA [Candidatus Abyssobacteria bacterium SURF_5]|uniref:LexA repressor n=1 Tax=Abyssobacteria bacterium (strain SURF_5) TaxID=2093360 RepID=A0A3A4NW20_ABYX5|nr:MAG: transcriptional repressor LexA [Candidatus Abyssubacteria bacterium SURF_5]